MAQLLKQSTAYTFQLGPFVDSIDGVTPKTSLTIAATDVDVSKNGGSFADKNDATALTGTGDSQGYYDCVLDTTDTGTLGKLEIRCYVSGALPVKFAFQVVPAHVYDGLVAGSDYLQVDTQQVLGTATTATFDSLSSQISSIGSGTGAALNFAVSEDNASSPIKSVTAVGTETGTYANTLADDGTLHQIASVGNAIDWVYGFSCGTARSASKFVSRAYMNATGDTVTVSAYNFSTTNWDTRTTITGTTETLRDVPLLSAHTGVSGSDAGKVYIRFTFSEADAGTLIVDEAYVQAQQSGSLVGYSDGAVWLNTGASNTNTVPYVDGVADNPVSTIAVALTLAAALKLKRIRVANGSSVTLGAAVESYSLVGKNWSLALGGQSISGSYIEGATVTGTGTGASAPTFVDCHLVGASAAPTLPPSTLYRCGINTTETYPLTAGSTGQFLFVDCFSEVAGSGTPYFTFSGANGINLRRWSGGTNITLDNTATALSIEVLTGGGQTVAVGGADVEIRGICRAVTLTGVTSNSKVQIDAVTGPISIAGADGEVNIYGVCGAVTDSRTGTPTLSNVAVSRATINAESDTALADYDAPTATEMTNAFTEIKGATWSASTDTLEHIRDKETDIETDTQDLQTQVGTDGAGLTAIPWNSAWDAEVNAEVVDVLRTDTLPDDYAAHEAQPTIAEAILAIHQFLFERSVSGTTVTVQKPDGTTTAMTLTLDDGTNPTAIHRSA